MICIVYVNDTIIASPISEPIDELIISLGITDEEQRHTFELCDENFLDIRIKNQDLYDII